MYRLTLAQMEYQINVLLNNCKHNITSLSLLVGTTVHRLAVSCTLRYGLYVNLTNLHIILRNVDIYLFFIQNTFGIYVNITNT